MAKAKKKLYQLVPTTWLDPMLTGPDAVLTGSGPWSGPDIERLLLAIRERIQEAELSDIPREPHKG